jgi:hypothetical protein
MKPNFLDKTIFRILMLFSFIVVVMAAVAIGALAFNLRNTPVQNQQPQGNTPVTPPPTTQPVTPPAVVPPAVQPPVTPPTTPPANPTQDWTRFTNQNQKYSFLLPPAKSPHIFTKEGKTWSWIFGNRKLDPQPSMFGFGTYSKASFIGFYPSNLNEIACGAGCVEENLIDVFSGDFSGTLDELLLQYQSSTSTDVNAPKLVSSEKLTKWGREVYSLKISGLMASEQTNYYIFTANQTKYFVQVLNYSTNAQADLDLVTITDSLQF